jgi:hypothetical protein
MPSITSLNANVVDQLVKAYPAPLCEGCNEPMWVKRRISYTGTTEHSVQLGFECCRCRTHVRMSGRRSAARFAVV